MNWDERKDFQYVLFAMTVAYSAQVSLLHSVAGSSSVSAALIMVFISITSAVNILSRMFSSLLCHLNTHFWDITHIKTIVTYTWNCALSMIALSHELDETVRDSCHHRAALDRNQRFDPGEKFCQSLQYICGQIHQKCPCPRMPIPDPDYVNKAGTCSPHWWQHHGLWYGSPETCLWHGFLDDGRNNRRS